MSPARTRDVNGLRVGLIDRAEDVAELGEVDVIVCGAPATLHAARTLLRVTPRLIVLHDGGVGKDAAGIAGLERLADVGTAAVAVDHDSARIGDANDVFEHGVASHLNGPAERLGLELRPIRDQVAHLEARQARADSTGEPVA